MGHNQAKNAKQKQEFVKLLSDGKTTLEIVQKFNRDGRIIEKKKLKTLAT